MQNTPLSPAYGTGQVVTASAVAAAVTGLNAGDGQLCLTNLGASVVYVRSTRATDATNATTADYPVPPGAQVVLNKGVDGFTRLSYISAGGTTLHVMTGNGW